MLNNLQQMDPNDLRHHIFIGTVVANDDPRQIERIKVSIPKMFAGADLNLYPWIAPRDGGPIATAQNEGSFGLVPRVGSKVFVQFQQGDPLFGLYWKAPILSGLRPAEANVNYPNRYGWRDPAGNVFFVDTTPGSVTVRLNHPSGAYVEIDNAGKMTFNAPGGIDQLTDGDINLTAAGNVNVTGAQIHLNES